MIDEAEVSETISSFTLTKAPTKINVVDLPLSPKKALLSAAACGWQVRAWEAFGDTAPKLYMSSSEGQGYSVGDVKTDGYVSRLVTIEARDLDLPLGFKAHYLGKVYANGRKAAAGSFAYAAVVDPVGIPRELRATYKVIAYHRGKFETEASFNNNSNRAQEMADEQDGYNDGRLLFQGRHLFKTAGDFDAWLAEWKSYNTAVTTIKKAASDA